MILHMKQNHNIPSLKFIKEIQCNRNFVDDIFGKITNHIYER